jgi:hypothetical protein
MANRIYNVIVLYVILVMLIFLTKPAMVFDASSKLKKFNYDERETSSSLINMEVLLSILAVFCYFIVISLEMIMY